MEKIIIVPERVRGLGNVLKEDKRVVFSNIYSEHNVLGNEIIEGKEYEVNSLNYVNSFLYFTSYPVKTVVGYTETFAGVVKDTNYDVLSGVSVDVYIDGELFDTFTSDSEGIITFSTEFSEGDHDLQLSYNNLRSGKINITSINPDELVVDDIRVAAGNTIEIPVTVKYNHNIVSNVPVIATINGETVTAFTNNSGVAVFEYTGRGYDNSIIISCGELSKTVPIYDAWLFYNQGELLLGKDLVWNPIMTSILYNWDSNGLNLEYNGNTNDNFYYLSAYYHDDSSTDTFAEYLATNGCSVEFTWKKGSGSIPLNFRLARGRVSREQPSFGFIFGGDGNRYYVINTRGVNRNFNGSLNNGDKFRLEFEASGTVTIYRNGSVLTSETYVNTGIFYFLFYLLNDTSKACYDDIKISSLPPAAVDEVTLSSNVNTCYVGDTVRFTANVVDEDDNPLVGRTVSFKSGNTTLGTGITDSQGDAIFDYETTSTGSLSVTAECENVTSSSVSVVVNNAQSVPASVTLTSDKSILSKADNESATLTATVLDSNSQPVEGETVSFSVAGTTIGTDTTDANGEATATYTSAGAGDVNATATVRTLVSETYSLEDCTYYNSNEVSIGGTNKNVLYDSDMSVALSTNAEISFYCTTVTSSTSKDYRWWLYSKALVNGMNYPTNGLFFQKRTTTIEYNQQTNGGYLYPTHKTGVCSSYALMKFVKEGTSVKLYADGNLIFTDTVSWIDNYSDYTITMMKWSGSETMKMKEVKIKPL